MKEDKGTEEGEQKKVKTLIKKWTRNKSLKGLASSGLLSTHGASVQIRVFALCQLDLGERCQMYTEVRQTKLHLTYLALQVC